MGLFDKKRNNADIFNKISELNSKHTSMCTYQYHDDIAIAICKILNATGDEVNRIYDEMFQCTSELCKNDIFNKTKLPVLQAFFENKDLSDDRLLQILKHSGDRVSMYYLCMPHVRMTPVISYAIDRIDHLSLKIVESCVDISKMPYFVLSELFPFFKTEILSDKKYNFFFENINNDANVMNLLHGGVLSQEQLCCVCNNIHLMPETRDMAFSLLEDVNSVSNLTNHMKNSLYLSAADAIFDYRDIEHNSKNDAIIYLYEATLNPEKMLTESLEGDLVQRIYKTDKTLKHHFIENLLENGKNKKTFGNIGFLSNNMYVEAEAASKFGKVDHCIFSNLVFNIEDTLERNQPLSETQLSAFRAIMGNENVVKDATVHEYGKLLRICFANNAVSVDIQAILATAYGIPESVLNNLAEAGAEEIKHFANFHLSVMKFPFKEKEKRLIIRLLQNIFFKEYDEGFLCDEVVVFESGRAYKETLAMIGCGNVFTIDNPTQYNIILNSFDNLLTSSLFRYNLRAKFAIESMRDYILSPFENKYWNLRAKREKEKNNYFVFKFYELQKLLMNCKSEFDYYKFFNNFGKDYIELYEKVSGKIERKEIRHIPTYLTKVFSIN